MSFWEFIKIDSSSLLTLIISEIVFALVLSVVWIGFWRFVKTQNAKRAAKMMKMMQENQTNLPMEHDDSPKGQVVSSADRAEGEPD